MLRLRLYYAIEKPNSSHNEKTYRDSGEKKNSLLTERKKEREREIPDMTSVTTQSRRKPSRNMMNEQQEPSETNYYSLFKVVLKIFFN